MSCGWACSFSCTGFRNPWVSADLARYKAEVVAGHEQQEQRQRQSDSQRERLHGAPGVAAVGHQKKHRRAQARHNRDEQEDDDDFHGAAAGTFCAECTPCEIMTGIRIRGRAFRPGIAPGVAAAAFIALAISLGNWQARRAEEKLELGRRLDEGAKGPVLSVSSVRLDASAVERRRVSARGRFDARAILLIDNKVLHGAAGYHVLTPLELEGGGDLHVLVNRGWIAAGDRSRLPAVPTPEAVQTIEGIAVTPSRRFFELAPEAASGPLRQNLGPEREEKRLGLLLQPFVIEQTSGARDGPVREWQRPDTAVRRHRS